MPDRACERYFANQGDAGTLDLQRAESGLEWPPIAVHATLLGMQGGFRDIPD